MTYLLEVKDRHNGNMLIDNVGHIIHIDFGFIFGMSPGGINFENAPFKFTLEMAELMNGLNSDLYRYFKNLMIKGFQHLSRHIDEIMLIIDIMMD